MPLQPGTILENRYRVESLLGQGGMGAAYLVWDARLEQWQAHDALTYLHSQNQPIIHRDVKCVRHAKRIHCHA